MTIRVLNKRDGAHDGHYVGRPSPLGNPYAIGQDGTRDEVIRLYRIWLWNEFSFQANPPASRRMLMRLYKEWQDEGELKLICWCAPQPCHADQIKALLEWMAENKEAWNG